MSRSRTTKFELTVAQCTWIFNFSDLPSDLCNTNNYRSVALTCDFAILIIPIYWTWRLAQRPVYPDMLKVEFFRSHLVYHRDLAGRQVSSAAKPSSSGTKIFRQNRALSVIVFSRFLLIHPPLFDDHRWTPMPWFLFRSLFFLHRVHPKAIRLIEVLKSSQTHSRNENIHFWG